MRVTIVLPAYYNFPIGGYHVHYKYANLLADKGHEVTILFPKYVDSFRTWKTPLSTLLWNIKTRIKNRPLVPSFKLAKSVKIRLVTNLQGSSVPKADVIIATAWQTADALRNADITRGKKFYIVYDYEYWMTASEVVRKKIERTFGTPYDVIATSKIVQSMVNQFGVNPIANIQCGIDFSEFGIDVPPQARNRFTLGFPARGESFKGLDDAIAAALILKNQYGDKLTISAFGSKKLNLPDWINWVQYPSQLELRKFYNDNAIFLLPSHFEGWGLTGVEALACGAALVVTDNGGSSDYAIHEHTALVVPPKQPREIAAAVSRLMENDELRIKLAFEGCKYVQQFNWENAAAKLESVLRV